MISETNSQTNQKLISRRLDLKSPISPIRSKTYRMRIFNITQSIFDWLKWICCLVMLHR